MPRYSPYARYDPPLWSGFLTPTTRAAALRENRGHCLDCHEDTHSLRQCRQPFVNASACLKPDLEQLGDDGEGYRRWHARMNRYRPVDKSSRSNKNSHKNNRRRRGNSRGQHQSQGQASTQNNGFNTHVEDGNHQFGSGHHGDVSPSPVSFAVAPSFGCIS